MKLLKVFTLFVFISMICNAAPPPPFDKERTSDTTFIIVSSGATEPKEYSIADPSNPEYTTTRKTGEVVTHGVPPMKVICTGSNIKFILSPKLVGASGLLRDKNDSLVWKCKVPKSEEVELDASGLIPGKYYGGIYNYKFGIIKE
jgi:hypothetical protein